MHLSLGGTFMQRSASTCTISSVLYRHEPAQMSIGRGPNRNTTGVSAMQNCAYRQQRGLAEFPSYRRRGPLQCLAFSLGQASADTLHMWRLMGQLPMEKVVRRVRQLARLLLHDSILFAFERRMPYACTLQLTASNWFSSVAQPFCGSDVLFRWPTSDDGAGANLDHPLVR